MRIRMSKENFASDDLTYTIQVILPAKIGYHRLFDIKPVNTRYGGRIIFDDRIDLNHYISFLESTSKLFMKRYRVLV